MVNIETLQSMKILSNTRSILLVHTHTHTHSLSLSLFYFYYYYFS